MNVTITVYRYVSRAEVAEFELPAGVTLNHGPDTLFINGPLESAVEVARHFNTVAEKDGE